MEYKYYEYDNAFYRRPASVNNPVVTEVKTPLGWKPYDGDKIAPVFFGDEVSAEDAGEKF
jgi:hypothetical protein